MKDAIGHELVVQTKEKQFMNMLSQSIERSSTKKSKKKVDSLISSFKSKMSQSLKLQSQVSACSECESPLKPDDFGQFNK